MMLVYLYKCQSHALIFGTLKTCLTTRILNIRSYGNKEIVPTNLDSSDFKISFLKNKCGLSGKPLIAVSKSVDFDQRANSVLDLFRTFGFPLSTITKIVTRYPHILHDIYPEKYLRPKLDFLLSISKSQAEVVAIVTKNPQIVRRSLRNFLIPSLNMLNQITGCYPNSVDVLKFNPYILSYDLSKNLLLNTQFLVSLGVPNSQILKLLKSYGPVLGEPHDKLRSVALKVKDMGFDPKSSYFLNALRVLLFVRDSSWKSRCVLFRSFGFTDDDILSMFMKLPMVMCYNEKNMKQKMEFFLKKLHLTHSWLSSIPAVLAYSLEKRTIPRCSVLQVLDIKNITSKSYMFSSMLIMSERKFVEDFVTEHKDEVPEVIEAYHGKLRFDEYTFKRGDN